MIFTPYELVCSLGLQFKAFFNRQPPTADRQPISFLFPLNKDSFLLLPPYQRGTKGVVFTPTHLHSDKARGNPLHMRRHQWKQDIQILR